jgi:hypothetical protein
MCFFFIFRPYLNEQVLEMEHTRILEMALGEFNLRSVRSIG